MDASKGRTCIYLAGAAGFPNYGDEAIAAAWLAYLARVAPEADVWLDCPHPGTAALLLADLHPRARFVDTLWRLAWQAPQEEPIEVASWVQHAIHNPGLGARWGAGIELLARADVVHVIGGGYVNGMWPRHVGVIAGAAAALRRSGGRGAITGLGLAPSDLTLSRTLQALADRFEVVDVRDEASAAVLGRAGSATADDVFLDVQRLHPTAGEDAPTYMLCLQTDLLEPATVHDLAAFALAVLRYWQVSPEDVGIVEGIPGHDRAAYSAIEHELPGARFYPFSVVWAAGLPVTARQTWLSTRFHVHLVAAAAGAGGLAVSPGTGYYGTKHRSLEEAGSGWSVLADLGSLPDPPAEGFGTEALEQLRAAKHRVAETIYRTATPEPHAEAPVVSGPSPAS